MPEHMQDKRDNFRARKLSTRILHISDLHFGAHFLPRVAGALITQVEELRPHALVVSGDLTQRAKPDEFKAARIYIEGLPVAHKLIVPGNHDIPLYRLWERLLAPRVGFQQNFEQPPLVRLVDNNVALVGLDSTETWRSFVNGSLDDDQLSFCQQELVKIPSELLKVVVMHHHLIPAPSFDSPKPMRRAKKILDTLTAAKVDMVLAGHLHRAYVGNSLDVYTGADRSHGIIVVQCGTTTSRRGRGLEQEKNSFNVIDVVENRIVVSHYLYLSDAHKFVKNSETHFPKRNVELQ